VNDDESTVSTEKVFTFSSPLQSFGRAVVKIKAKAEENKKVATTKNDLRFKK
jgi:hypothetical protein